MPIYVDETTPADEICRCGRLKRKIHCPMCGGYTILALGEKRSTRRVINQATGETKDFAAFRCRRCSLYFDDLDWRVACEAPRFETRSMRQRRQEQNARESFQSIVAAKGGDRKAALRELFAKVQPKTEVQVDLAKTRVDNPVVDVESDQKGE